MLTVKLVSKGTENPLVLTTAAARTCYKEELPEHDEIMNVEGQLWKTGHHTTLEHSYYTFAIEGIAIGDVTFGLHLASPFYNTDQRSGRFTFGMFNEGGVTAAGAYLAAHYPELSEEDVKRILTEVSHGLYVFNDNIELATTQAAAQIRRERPKATDKYIEANAKKIAQEQLRMFVPVVFPTAMYYTVNLVTLAALYESAWTPGMRAAVEKMVALVLLDEPRLGYLFVERGNRDWAPGIEGTAHVVYSPESTVLSLEEYHGSWPTEEEMHPLDLLRMHPGCMDLATSSYTVRSRMSVATMGQDQRHRTVRRGTPVYTGGFYLPPVPYELPGLNEAALESIGAFLELTAGLPETLRSLLAPYGAVVEYTKQADLAATIHEKGKRTCWCAQEEIYNLSVLERRQIAELYPNHPILSALSPRCFGGEMKCGEGGRYCGRDIATQHSGDYFPTRKI